MCPSNRISTNLMPSTRPLYNERTKTFPQAITPSLEGESFLSGGTRW